MCSEVSFFNPRLLLKITLTFCLLLLISSCIMYFSCQGESCLTDINVLCSVHAVINFGCILFPMKPPSSSWGGSSARSILLWRCMPAYLENDMVGHLGSTSTHCVTWRRAMCHFTTAMGNMWSNFSGWWVWSAHINAVFVFLIRIRKIPTWTQFWFYASLWWASSAQSSI